jgi:hypothetical protein
MGMPHPFPLHKWRGSRAEGEATTLAHLLDTSALYGLTMSGSLEIGSHFHIRLPFSRYHA